MTLSALTKLQNAYMSVVHRLFTVGAQDTMISLNPLQLSKQR